MESCVWLYRSVKRAKRLRGVGTYRSFMGTGGRVKNREAGLDLLVVLSGRECGRLERVGNLKVRRG